MYLLEVDTATENYFCINCGSPVTYLYKKYSETVLKLTECKHCKNVADKYVEYDTLFVVIDLILLKVSAFRHVLLNVQFKNFWKLSIILLFLETYSSWSVSAKNNPKQSELNDTKPYLSEPDIYLEDFKFYILFIEILICKYFKLSISSIQTTVCFVGVIYMLTTAFTFVRRQMRIPLLKIYKMVTISSIGIFLFLPSLMWDMSVHNFHLHFVSVYITLSQLLAYKALCNCEKGWSLLVVILSTLVRIYIKNCLNTIKFVASFLPD
ncbi:hypothetical protein NQ315_005365 [Exocentrus adspersus]|uniref:Protein ARV n=1 Tax=Exocentrus adspersus TaxID=1586481 RepID=A0AAV8W318_9CUCU|nr:hypothetical protein NQ315_005365 [Exocentrus adspersus]